MVKTPTPYSERNHRERSQSERNQSDRNHSERSQSERSQSERIHSERSQSGRTLCPAHEGRPLQAREMCICVSGDEQER